MKKRKKISLPTQQQIDKLVRQGKLNELRSLNERLAKTANQRMAQLYKSGIKSTAALDRAKYYTEQVSPVMTGGVFSRSKKLDMETLSEQLKEELIFLRSESSTVSGEKYIRASKSFETLTSGEKPYLEIPEDVKVPPEWNGSESEYFKEKFLSFLETDAWKDIKKFLYSTDTNILQDAGEAIARGADIQELKEGYKAFLRGEVGRFEYWENWISV